MGVRCPVVVGRDAELSLLEGLVDAAARRKGNVLFLVGEAGIGKSRLTREAEAMARQRGMRIFRGRAVQAAVPVPFRPFAEAFSAAGLEDAVRTAPELSPYRRALVRLVPEWGEGGGDQGSEAPALLALEGIRHLLRALAETDGLLLVLEDLHWADGDTLAAVEYLADHPLPGVLCVGTARSDDPGPGADLAETLDARRVATRIALSRLSEQDVDRMIRESMLKQLPHDVSEAVRVRAEGVPFLVEEILSAFTRDVEGDPTAWLHTLPPSYRALVRDRLGALSAAASAVIGAGAVVGRTFDWALLAAVTGLEETRVLAGLREGVAAQLVEGAGGGAQVTFGFRHALVREAVLEELLGAERAALSLRSAEVIEELYPGLPGDWCELAAELRENGGDQRGAARHLLEAGRRALARSALATAEATLERARALAVEDPWLVLGICRILLESLALSGKVARLREVGDELLSFFEESVVGELWSHLMAPVHLRIARGMAVAAGDWTIASQHLEKARAIADPADEALRARIDAFSAHAALAEGDLDESIRRSESALAVAERLGSSAVICEALEAMGRAAFLQLDEHAEAWLRRAADIAEVEGLSALRSRALLALGTTERCTHGKLGVLREARRVAGDADAVAVAARADLEIGRGLTERFDLAAAAPTLENCIAACRRYRMPLLAEALLARATSLALLDRMSEADSALAEAEPLIFEGSHVTADASEARCIIALVAGDRPRARADLAQAAEVLSRSSAAEPRPVAGLAGLIAALNDDADAAAAVATAPHAAHRATLGYLAFVEAARLGGEAKAGGAGDRFASADRLMEPFPWHRHVGRLLTAEVAAHDGWGSPAEWMVETLAFFEVAGHRGLADACKRVLRLVGAPVPRRGRGDSYVPEPLRALGVTSREMDVLLLVTEGLSNPQIAARLHLSRRTVESHIASLLRRTGAATREQLRAVAGEAG